MVLRTQRLRAGLTQQQLSQLAGVSIRTVREIEAGRVQTPRAASVRRLAATFGLDPDEAVAASRRTSVGRSEWPAAPSAAAGWEVGVLGPLVLRRHGLPVELGSRMQRLALGILAIQPGQVVRLQELIDWLWGEHPPASCFNLVHTYMSRLRRLLEPSGTSSTSPGVIVTSGDGYRLVTDDLDLDVVRFDHLSRQAEEVRAVDPELALRMLGAAVGLWRGDVLADLGGRVRQHPTVVALTQQRVQVTLTFAELALRVGRPEQAVTRLGALAQAEPLHERVHAQLMLALAGSGQHAAALRVFADLRARLVEELGVEPGAEVQDVHLRVLRGDLGPAQPASGALTSARTPPAQLPADVAGFTGRKPYLDQLDSLVFGGEPSRRVVVTAIDGMAGVGKTALAVHWAHAAADRFPDGQLFVNLRGHGAREPHEPLQALVALLAGLGVAPERIPVDLEAAAGLYRSLLANRQVLVVLDDARNAEQVRPLLPGSPGCVVLITTRTRLTGLVATHGVHRLSLDVLPPNDAVALLEQLLGRDRVAADPKAAGELARLCGWLPLALRIAGAHLAEQPELQLADYVTGLRAGDRLTELTADDDPWAAVRTAFGASYQHLDPDGRRAFRLLGLAPGPEVSVQAAAALAGTSPVTATRQLRALAAAHLIEPRGRGRYGLHDLLRLYARERADQEDSRQDRDQAGARLMGWYLRAADAAVSLLHPELLRLPVPPTPADAIVPVGFDTPAQAMAWLEAERASLVAAVHHAAVHGPRPHAMLLADSLHAYFALRNYTVEWLRTANAGLRVAVEISHARGQVASHLSLGGAQQAAGSYTHAVDHFTQALTLARQARWVDAESEALNGLGLVHWWSGNLQAAADHSTKALALARQTGRPTGQTSAHLRIALAYLQQGRLTDAADHQTQALRLFRRIGLRSGEARALATLGISLHQLGRLSDAHQRLTRSLSLMRELGDRFGESYVLRTLAAVHRDAGRNSQALETARAAVALTGEIGHRFVQAAAHNTLASVYLKQDDHRQATHHYRRALDLARETGTRAHQAEALIGLAGSCVDTGHPRQAIDQAQQAIQIATLTGMRVHEGQARTMLAAAHRELGRNDLARDHARQALELHRQTGYRLGQARTLELLGVLHEDVGEVTEAASYREQAQTLYADIGSAGPDQRIP